MAEQQQFQSVVTFGDNEAVIDFTARNVQDLINTIRQSPDLAVPASPLRIFATNPAVNNNAPHLAPSSNVPIGGYPHLFVQATGAAGGQGGSQALESKIDDVITMLKELKDVDEQKSLSAISGVDWEKIKECLDLQMENVKISLQATQKKIEPYKWDARTETNQLAPKKGKKGKKKEEDEEEEEEGGEDMQEYAGGAKKDGEASSSQIYCIDWFLSNLPLPEGLSYYNVSTDGTFLNVFKKYQDFLPHSLKGTTDLVIAPSGTPSTILDSHFYIAIEVKKTLKKKSSYQGWCQLIASSLHVHGPVVHLLTDLGTFWQYSWWTKDNHNNYVLSFCQLDINQSAMFLSSLLSTQYGAHIPEGHGLYFAPKSWIHPSGQLPKNLIQPLQYHPKKRSDGHHPDLGIANFGEIDDTPHLTEFVRLSQQIHNDYLSYYS